MTLAAFVIYAQAGKFIKKLSAKYELPEMDALKSPDDYATGNIEFSCGKMNSENFLYIISDALLRAAVKKHTGYKNEKEIEHEEI